MGRKPLDYEKGKRNVKVNIDNILIDKANEMNLNLSKISRDAIFYVVNQASDEERKKYYKK
ncbi:hypothetical protein P7H50_14150 [Enterococcus durans]|uniref:type II toxin-antitoxin system CcdA family antitoxin n=1 Tax=Enterococcus durans TaxID=53345 RepID=UPI00288EC3FD|nr:type II toxin-antitoxin system CcdA family antitoxin [Enterococcus durans]MDT2837994.1 hypothetical protein [Enterococcus durans]